MTRTETIHELNEERKRKEMLVWQKFLATTATKTTAERVKERTVEMERIRDEYAKALLQVDRGTTNEKYQNTIPEKGQQKGTNTQTRNVLQKEKPNDDILKGAENLPENQPLTPTQEGSKKNIDGIQGPQNEPAFVRNAREQNRSEQVQEVQYEESDSTQEENLSEQSQYLEGKQMATIRDEFEASGINLSDITDSSNDTDLLSEIKEARKTSSLHFPILILFVAVLKDCSDILASLLQTIPFFGIVVWFVAAGFSITCSGIIWFWMLGKGSKMQRKIIIKFVAQRLPLILVGISAELLPFLSLIPTTTITVFFIAQTSTKLGQTIHKAAEKADELKS